MAPFMVRKKIRHDELIERLQVDARMLFYDRMMYDINDSLTSILALCDIEAKKSVPRIKEYISRINDSLQNTKNYHISFTGEKRFNITLLTRNILRVLEDNYKSVQFTPFISDIKAPCIGDQSLFEQVVLCMLIDMCEEKGAGESAIRLELKQESQNALLTLYKEGFTFTRECQARIDKFTAESDFQGKLQVQNDKKGTEAVIRVPLEFKTVTFQKPQVKGTSSSEQRAPAQSAKLFSWDGMDIAPGAA